MLRNPIELADRYVAVWNEPSPDARRAAVSALWAEDGVHVLQPPEDAVKAAGSLDIVPIFQASGHDWGTDFLVLDATGRIRADYQFIEA